MNTHYKGITEDVKLILEFMGCIVELRDSGEEIRVIDWPDNYYPVYFMDNNNAICLENMLFDLSWDWIMPVVEKAEKLGYEVSIIQNECDIGEQADPNKFKPIISNTGDVKIDATYWSVVEFIKWYNKNNKL